MKVCIAEKPSVAKEIAFVIGAKSRKDGYFEGNGYQVTWTFGHFCTLLQPHDYKPQWKQWNLDSLPMLPDHFCRTHGSYIVNLQKVEELKLGTDEILVGGQTIPIGRKFKKDFLEQLVIL